MKRHAGSAGIATPSPKEQDNSSCLGWKNAFTVEKHVNECIFGLDKYEHFSTSVVQGSPVVDGCKVLLPSPAAPLPCWKLALTITQNQNN